MKHLAIIVVLVELFAIRLRAGDAGSNTNTPPSLATTNSYAAFSERVMRMREKDMASSDGPHAAQAHAMIVRQIHQSMTSSDTNRDSVYASERALAQLQHDEAMRHAAAILPPPVAVLPPRIIATNQPPNTEIGCKTRP
jgi:hypothetical protein